MMFKHVLIPLDGSLLAEGAIPYAKAICQGNTQITLFRVTDLPWDPAYFTPVPEVPLNMDDFAVFRDEQIRSAQAYLAKLQAELEPYFPTTTMVVDSRDAAGAIIDFSEDNAVDGIVMVTHGRSGFGRWLFGSVTQRVLQAAPCPILVIPRPIVEDTPDYQHQREANPDVS